MNYPFKVEFFGKDISGKETKRARLFKYSACVTVVSKNFQLFEVSNIKILNKHKEADLEVNYIVTSYPFDNIIDSKWKDAVTLTSSAFLRELGLAIEKSIGKEFCN